jgi:DNA-binding beta-propeller fold protein YncE
MPGVARKQLPGISPLTTARARGIHGAAVSLLALSADAGDSWVPHGAESPAPGGERPSSCLGVSTARFYWPSGVAVDNAGSVYVANTDNHASRRVTPDGW